MHLSVKNTYLRIFLQFLVVVTPYILFGLIYGSMKYYPNYLFGTIDTEGVYNMEKMLFGISTPEGTLTPCEYFTKNHWAVMDVMSGIFYLLWVPLPIAYTIWLFFTGQKALSFRLSCAFLFVNLVGFTGYYIYPSCPPWYVQQYGFDVVFNTPGNVAGFENFDRIVGFPLFHSIYANNANVFAAIPSLHSAYNPIAFFYALKVRHNAPWITVLAVVSIGIWFSAVYSSHHYIIDVLLGILTVFIGLGLFEGVLLKIKAVRNFFTSVNNFIC